MQYETSPVSIAPKALPGQCYHCQEPIPSGLHIQIDHKDFCCEGCKTVYEILNTHNLCAFYSIDEQAGLSQRNQRDARSYAWLDDADVQDKLIEFSDGHTAQTTFYLPQMHCASCLWLLEHLYKLDSGITHSKVNFLKKIVSIQFDPALTNLRKLAALLASIGYAPEINLGDLDQKSRPGISKRLAYQLGVAGFATGNIMLFSFPEYVGMDRAAEQWFSHIFGYFSLFLATPVLLFSARDFMASAWQGIRTRTMNVDIPLALGMLMLYFRSAWEILANTGGGYLDSFSGLVFLMLIGRWFQQITWYRLSFERDYKSYFPVAATRKEGLKEEVVPVNRLVPGDIILIRNGEIIPADGVLLRGSANVDYSFVTGESEPVAVHNGEKIYAGGCQKGETLEISLTKRVSNSYLTNLWNNEAFKAPARGEVTKLADQAGHVFSWLILSAGLGALIYWMPRDTATAVNAFTAVMIVACPCNIVLSIPFTLGNILRLLGRNRFYLKNIAAVEAFTGIHSVVFDKTGTITNTAGQLFDFIGTSLSADEKSAIRSLTRHSAHPISRQLFAAFADVPWQAVEQFTEIPGQGIRGRVGGKVFQLGSAAFIGSSGEGLFLSVDGVLRGHFEVKNRFRMGLKPLLDFFRIQKRHLWLLTGDNEREATQLQSFFPASDALRFHQSPQDKLDFIKKLQQRSQRVLMIGDGLNDAGALRQSDLGIVVAEDTNNFTPACDGILHAAEFHRLPQFVRLAESGVQIVRWSYAVALTYNFIGLSYALSGALSPLVAAVLMPISSVSVVLFGVLMGNWRARRLGLLSLENKSQ